MNPNFHTTNITVTLEVLYKEEKTECIKNKCYAIWVR